MKHSISKRFAFIFILLMAGAIALCWFINSFFLVKYYRYNKINALKKTCEVILETYENGEIKEDAGMMRIVKSAELNNISLFINDYTNKAYFSNLYDHTQLEYKLNSYVIEDALSGGSKPDNFVLREEYDTQSTMTYLEIWGCLDLSPQVYFIIRTPVESINESVSISNRFLLYVGIFVTLISAFILLFVTKRMTRPISNLSEISKRMAELDFTARYSHKGRKDEIDELGENMNILSGNLEKTILELKTANNSLKQDIKKREQIDEMRKEFLSNVSHELKTPLALIEGYAEGLSEGIADDEESRQYYCEVILDEAGKMNEMVKKLLSLNQLEFGNEELNYERFDIVELIHNFLQSADILTKQAGATVEFMDYEPVYVYADSYMTEEVLRNYFSNALNHVDFERIIEVKVLRGSGKIRVSVFNTGKPIPEESIGSIWDKFYKVDKARTRAYGGSGVGLSIVKAIMTKMNEAYGVRNYDNGVEFFFELDDAGEVLTEN